MAIKRLSNLHGRARLGSNGFAVYYPSACRFHRYLSTGDSQRTPYASQNAVGGLGNFAALCDDFMIFLQVPFVLTDVHW